MEYNGTVFPLLCATHELRNSTCATCQHKAFDLKHTHTDPLSLEHYEEDTIMDALQDKKVDFFSMDNMKSNEKAVEYVHTSMCVIAGCIAGITGMTGLQGFLFLATAYVFTAIALWLFKLNMDVHVYFTTSTFAFIFAGVMSQSLSFILFWTLSYGLVHIY